jgi:N-acetyl-gamma-glutamyl-phosphate reductase
METIKVGVYGGSGYGGSDLLRIALFHPNIDIVAVTAHSHAGKRVDEVHPNLMGYTELVFQTEIPQETLAELDCVFLCLPHRQSMAVVPTLPKHLKIVDLAGDYRLRDQDVFEEYYKIEHTSFEHQAGFTYGLTEMNREAIANSQRVACPGCFATSALVGLFPLVKANVLEAKIVVDAKTGSSGSGNKPKEGTHHPKRANSFYSYKPFTHQHVPEVVQALKEAQPEWEGRLVFQTHSAPMVRGIFTSIYVTLTEDMTADEIAAIFHETYKDSPFVRIRPKSPDVNWVKTTNFADINWAQQGRDLNVFVAIDNLVKGSSGQAIQNMNLMFGLPETTGLSLPGSHP